MCEIVVLLFVVPFRVFPAAREHGRNAFAWSLVGMGIFLAGEFLVFGGYALIYSLSAMMFGWEEGVDETALSFTNILDIAALCVGMVCVEVLRYKLSNPSVPYFDSPPPPERFGGH